MEQKKCDDINKCPTEIRACSRILPYLRKPQINISQNILKSFYEDAALRHNTLKRGYPVLKLKKIQV